MNELVQVIKQIAGEAVEARKQADATYGKVLNIAPPEIRIELKLILPEEFFKLTKAVTDHYVDITVSHITENRAGGAERNRTA